MTPHEQAVQMGLTDLHFGRYGKDGHVTHRVQGNSLVPVQPKIQTAHPEQAAAMHQKYKMHPGDQMMSKTGHIAPLARMSPAGHPEHGLGHDVAYLHGHPNPFHPETLAPAKPHHILGKHVEDTVNDKLDDLHHEHLKNAYDAAGFEGTRRKYGRPHPDDAEEPPENPHQLSSFLSNKSETLGKIFGRWEEISGESAKALAHEVAKEYHDAVASSAKKQDKEAVFTDVIKSFQDGYMKPLANIEKKIPNLANMIGSRHAHGHDVHGENMEGLYGRNVVNKMVLGLSNENVDWLAQQDEKDLSDILDDASEYAQQNAMNSPSAINHKYVHRQLPIMFDKEITGMREHESKHYDTQAKLAKSEDQYQHDSQMGTEN